VIGIFRIDTPTEKRLMVYRSSFKWCGETFVIHRTPRIAIRHGFASGWRVSHKRTGCGVLRETQENGRRLHPAYPLPGEAREASLFFLRAKGRIAVKAAIEKARARSAAREIGADEAAHDPCYY